MTISHLFIYFFIFLDGNNQFLGFIIPHYYIQLLKGSWKAVHLWYVHDTDNLHFSTEFRSGPSQVCSCKQPLNILSHPYIHSIYNAVLYYF